MVATDLFVYLSKYVVGFFLVDTLEIRERVSLFIKGVVNKDKQVALICTFHASFLSFGS